MNFYGESILILKARGGTLPHDKTPLDDEYGVIFSSGDSSVIEVNYKQKRNPDGTIKNPLNEAKIDEIFELIMEEVVDIMIKFLNFLIQN